MALEDASHASSVGFVRTIERIREDGCFPNGEGENDNDRENP